MSSSATVTSKGQITIPASVRTALGLKAQDKVVFTVLPNGTTIMRVKNRSLAGLQGMLTPPEGVHVRVEDMNAWRD